jgi:SAM-dependent methyltransferase
MTTVAAERWREQLEAWAMPPELLDALPESPYGSPPVLWRRARRIEDGSGTGVTGAVLSRLLPKGGSLLDIGAGTGRVSLPLAAAGHRLTAVEASPAMAEGFRAEAYELGVEALLLEGRWPEAAADVDVHDVAVCANVVYDVAQPGPFLTALHARAGVAVVIELTPVHPWTHLIPYFRTLHGVEFPDGPDDGLFVEVIREVLGVEPRVERWWRRGVHLFADLQELLSYYGRRLRVPAERMEDLHAVLAPDVHEERGWLYVGEPKRETVTMWWPGGAG